MSIFNLRKIPISSIAKNYVPLKSQYAFRSKATAILQHYTAATLLGLMRVYKRVSRTLQGGAQIKQLDVPKDTVVIYQFPRGYNSPSLSPFALKLETFCRAANISYLNRFGMKASSQGLIPFIELNKFYVEDSQKCIEYLTEVFQKDLDSHLTQEQKAISQAVIKMTEDSLFWGIVMNRFWFRSEGRNDMKIPLLSYWYISYRIYKRAWMSGYGRYSKEDLFEITCKNLNALNVLIGKKKYLFSDTQPSIADFSIFGVCTQIKFSDSGPLNKYLNTKCHNILRHTENMKETYWKDWDDCIRAKRALKPINKE